MCGALLSFLEAIAVSGEGEDLGPMHETVNEGDNAGGVREDLVPFSERFIGRQDHGAMELITARDHLEEQISVTRVVGQVPHLVRLRCA